MTEPVAHVLGGGLAGLSAAARLAQAGIRPIVHEQAPQAGGRCRSFWDRGLELKIDNGNHFIMSGNTQALSFLRLLGAEGEMVGPAEALYPFYDHETGARFVVRPGRALTPLWALDPKRSVPGAALGDFAQGANLLTAGPDRTVAHAITQRGPLWRAFWEPLTVAALNAKPENAQARLLAPVLTRTFLKGGAYCRPLIARTSLADAFVEPARAYIVNAGGEVRLGARVKGIAFKNFRAAELHGAHVTPLGPKDIVVCALPPVGARELLPKLDAPDDGEAILNAHFRAEATPPPLPGGSLLMGVLGATTQWIALRGAHVSLTVSAASDLADAREEELLPTLWEECRAALRLPAQARYAAARIIREKRATFAPTPANVRRRPKPATQWANVILAGDWTDTGLPATIEGAILSGARAAALARRRIREL